MSVLSLGAGVQSTTLFGMGICGEIDMERAIFADTQDEPTATMDWLGGLQWAAGYAGIPLDIVTAGNLRDDSLSKPGWLVSIPAHVVSTSGKGGMLQRKCTNGYKLRPIKRRLRELGFTASNPVDLMVGISYDEAHRMRDSQVRYIHNVYPLVEMRMTRTDCVRWLRDHGYDEPPKSACRICPFRDNRAWRQMRDQAPDDWAIAVQFDQQVRHAAQMKQPTTAYLHRSLVSLPMVDLSTPRERAADAGQIDMFDEVSDGECGAFSCFGGAMS